MSQGCFNYRTDDYDPDDHMGPPSMAEIFISRQESSSASGRLKAYSRTGRLDYSTKRVFIPIVDPVGYAAMHRMKGSPFLEEFPDALRAQEALSLKKVDRTLAQIRSEAYALVHGIESKRERQIYLYENAELIIPVGETESGSFIYAGHHPSKKLSVEILMDAIELYITHSEKQQRPGNLCSELKAGAEAKANYKDLPIFTSAYQEGISTDINTPDEEMDAFLQDEDNFEEGN